MMTNTRTETTELGHQCSGQCTEEGPRVFHVHLDSGEIVSVPDVVHLTLTDQEVVLERADAEAIRFHRTAVFFACCGEDAPPAQL